MKRLVVKKRDRQYIIDDHDVRTKEDIILISGYDLNGMYFQIKHIGRYKIEETEASILIELK